ncbi:MAG: hypothetical protein ABIQ31_02105 [Ferruginibacter sp.]
MSVSIDDHILVLFPINIVAWSLVKRLKKAGERCCTRRSIKFKKPANPKERNCHTKA